MCIYKGLNKNNTALVVIDPINSCAHEKCEIPEWDIHFSKIRKMLPRLNRFIKEYRKKIGGLVMITTTSPWTRDYLPENLQELYKDPHATYYSDNSSGFEEEFNSVEIAKKDFIIAKNTYDAFTNSEFANKLIENKIKYIVITGIFTDGCVLSTVINGFSRGYNFVILKDLVETTDLKIRQNLQKLLIDFTFPKMYGVTTSSSEFLKEMLKKNS
ncbi:MAG: cysteine hydrolase [Candidatus Woesebacteria bacterium]|nr:MAG: cysteine hydrolase [Candidatus Woesebacteria bacterium]